MKRQGLVALGLAIGLGLGGVFPTALAASRPRASLITLNMLTTQQGWAMNTVGQVLQTTDGGRQWINVGNPVLARALQHATKDGSFYLRGPTPGGNLVASQGNGTFVAFPNPWTAWFTLSVAEDALQVWHTSDGGQHWTRTTIHRVAPPGGMGLSEIAAIGNQDAWIMAATQGLAGHVEFRIWRTSVHDPHWHPIFQGAAPNTEGLAFATGSVGVLAEGTNIISGSQTGALALTTTGGRTWSFTGDGSQQARALPQPSALPLLPSNNWLATTMDPAVVPHTTDLVIAVLMALPFPSKTNFLKIRWRLEQSTDGGRTWHMLPTTPDPVLAQWPNVIFQAWLTAQTGWVVLGSHLYRSSDGGRHWSPSTLPTGTVVNVSPVSSVEGFVLLQRGHVTTIYRTHDGGIHWRPVLAVEKPYYLRAPFDLARENDLKRVVT